MREAQNSMGDGGQWTELSTGSIARSEVLRLGRASESLGGLVRTQTAAGS